jgi:hypothetical protein
MLSESEILRKAIRMAPLVRSITSEARDRTEAIGRLEFRLKRLLSRHGNQLTKIRLVEGALFVQRRAIEQLRRELAPLNCTLDQEHPERIVWHVANREVCFEEQIRVVR